jgi:uncharacterized protein YaaN involved in tellurite resistance
MLNAIRTAIAKAIMPKGQDRMNRVLGRYEKDVQELSKSLSEMATEIKENNVKIDQLEDRNDQLTADALKSYVAMVRIKKIVNM